jgi:hypothetical protein
MKRDKTLAKINHPWNRYNMRMLRSWPIKIPNMNKMRQKSSEHAHIIPISRMADFCESYGPFHVCLTICPSAHKRQMTSCVHKMCERTYGQTNMKRAITLAKINHPWNRYNMLMVRSWAIKIPNMNKMRQSWMVGFCESYSPFHVCLTMRPFAHLVYATSHLSFMRQKTND